MKYNSIGVLGAFLLVVALVVSPVLAGGYKDYAAQDLGQVMAKQQGEWTLSGYLACHNNLFGQHLEIARDGADAAPGIIEISAAGYYETKLAEGKYTIVLPDGNGGQPEIVHVICEGYPAGMVYTDRPLLGHAATAPDAPVEEPDVIEILDAKYGKIVLIQAAYDEQVLVAPAHVEHRHDAAIFGHTNYVDGPKHGNWFAQLHQDERMVAAVYNTVHHNAVYAGAIVDVKAQVQAAVDAGHRALKFDNAQNPGGLFDANNNALLAQIADPAFGIVKEIDIDYKLNGIAKHIDAGEYQVINL